MPRLKWGATPPVVNQGLDRGVLYLPGKAVPWNGLVSVSEDPTHEIDVDHYFEGNRLWVTQTVGGYRGKISAYTYPGVLGESDGHSTPNIYQRYGLAYRTNYGDGYKLHIVYNLVVDLNSRTWASRGKSDDGSLFEWDISAYAAQIPGARPSARVTLDVTSTNEQALAGIEDILYGTDGTSARLPQPAELLAIYEEATVLRIVYHGDGSYTATGPEDMVRILGGGLFELNAPSVLLEGQDIFRVSSY